MSIQKTCNTCSSVFSVPPSRSKAKYCCKECVPRTGNGNPNWKGGLFARECVECGKKFHVKQKEVKAGRGKFCSRPCSMNFYGRKKSFAKNKNRVHKNCQNCGASIFIKPSHAHTEGKFCSIPCRSSFYKSNGTQAGKNNPRFSHGQSHFSGFYSSQRRTSEGVFTETDIEEIKEKQQHKCANCLNSIQGKEYHIDHIIPVSKNGTNWPHNIQILCPTCNLKKSAKDPIYWAQENGRLI